MNQFSNQSRELNSNIAPMKGNDIVGNYSNQENNNLSKTVKEVKLICYRCRQEGHIASMCPLKNKQNEVNNNKGNKTSANLIMSNKESMIKEGNLNYAYPKMNMAVGNEDSLIYVAGTIYNDFKFNKCEMILDTGAT